MELLPERGEALLDLVEEGQVAAAELPEEAGQLLLRADLRVHLDLDRLAICFVAQVCQGRDVAERVGRRVRFRDGLLRVELRQSLVGLLGLDAESRERVLDPLLLFLKLPQRL